MISRENHRLLNHTFLATFPVIDLLLFLLDEHEMTENVEQTVALKNLFPEIAGTITGRMLWITCATFYFAGVTSAVEWKEMRFLLLLSRGHVHFVRIGREMHKRA